MCRIRYSPSHGKPCFEMKRLASLPSSKRCFLTLGLDMLDYAYLMMVIPAPIAYVNVVAVKTLVVETPASSTRLHAKTGDEGMICLLEHAFTMNKIECSKQAIA